MAQIHPQPHILLPRSVVAAMLLLAFLVGCGGNTPAVHVSPTAVPTPTAVPNLPGGPDQLSQAQLLTRPASVPIQSVAIQAPPGQGTFPLTGKLAPNVAKWQQAMADRLVSLGYELAGDKAGLADKQVWLSGYEAGEGDNYRWTVAGVTSRGFVHSDLIYGNFAADPGYVGEGSNFVELVDGFGTDVVRTWEQYGRVWTPVVRDRDGNLLAVLDFYTRGFRLEPENAKAILGVVADEVVSAKGSVAYKLEGSLVEVVDADGKRHLLTNGFEVRDNQGQSEIWDWKDYRFVKVEMPTEITQFLSGEPESGTDRRARVVLEGAKMAIVDGKVVYQLSSIMDNSVILEYKDGKWQTADIFEALSETKLIEVQDQLASDSKYLESGLNLAGINDITFRNVVGFGFHENELYLLAMYGDGTEWVVIKPAMIGFDELLPAPGKPGWFTWNLFKYAGVEDLTTGDLAKYLWLFSDLNQKGIGTQLTLIGDEESGTDLGRLVENSSFTDADAQAVRLAWTQGKLTLKAISTEGLENIEFYISDDSAPDD